MTFLHRLSILTCFLLANVFISWSQIPKSTLMIGAGSNMAVNFGFTNILYNGKYLWNARTQHVSLMPSFGYFISDNNAMGICLPMEYLHSTSGDNKTTQSFLGLTPYFRHYFTSRMVKPYFHIDAGYKFTRNSSNSGVEANEYYHGFLADGGWGIAAFLSEKVSIDTQLQYNLSVLTYNNDKNLKKVTNGFGLIVGVSVLL